MTLAKLPAFGRVDPDETDALAGQLEVSPSIHVGGLGGRRCGNRRQHQDEGSDR